MQIYTKSLLIGLLCLSGSICYGQRIVTENSPIVCHASPEDIPTRIGPPASFVSNNARISSANIEVDYVGFTAQAQAAFQFAVDIWESQITSPVTIRVKATWTPLDAGVLGSAGPSFFEKNFDGAPQLEVYYPGALAEKLAGKELNESDEYDIEARFSSSFNWYYNSTGTPASGQYDLITVVLHELGHGLGFVDTYNYASGIGEIGSFSGGIPFPYDLNIETQAGLNLYQNYVSPSSQLGSRLVSGSLFYNSPLPVAANSGTKPKVYAPASWSGGSSIAHLDESTYPSTNINSLMTPQFGAREVNHNPGPITINLFKDLGWTTTYINHEPIANTLDNNASAFDVIATVTPDNTPGYAVTESSITLHYYTSNNSVNSDTLEVQMVTTGNAFEYSATLPAPGGNTLTYYYYISVDDNLARTITNPGKINAPLELPLQGFYSFQAGPDAEAPLLTHTPQEYISFLEEEVQLIVKAEERYDITSVEVEYTLAGVAQSNLPMNLIDSLTEESALTGLVSRFYEITIPITSLNNDEELSYRIIATDDALNENVGTSPATNFHTMVFKGQKELQESYINDFNVASDDFVAKGNDFSITQPEGFTNPAIHSVHPYIQAASIGLDSINYIYALRVPILVHSIGATIKFDEIVLVEPGEPGSVFGTTEFYDYVVTEGSTDGGTTWIPVADGYDASDYGPWLSRYNSLTNTTGVPSLFRSRTMNLLDKFNEGDEVLIRFRLFSDPGSAGWGWAIDNLKIQIDDEAPVQRHQHKDFVKADESSLSIISEVTDNIAVEKVVLEIGVNEDPVQFVEQPIGANSADVEFTVDLASFSAGDKIIYKLITSDESGNSHTVPASGYFEVSVLEFETAVAEYTNNFNSASDDFVGNFFSIAQPSGFSNGAIHSSHNYLTGFGPGNISDFTYTLKKPIIISDRNPDIRLDEIAIVEGHANGAVFGTPLFKDYVVIEGSKDGGATWKEFFAGYDVVGQSAWVTAFNTGSPGTPAMFRTRTFSMIENGDFADEDEVIIRFRLNSNATVIGWGWAIDNLYIQNSITVAAEKELDLSLSVYPNPVKEKIVVEASGLASPWFNIQLLNAHGQSLYTQQAESMNGNFSHSIPASNLANGVYFVKIFTADGQVIKKVIKID